MKTVMKILCVWGVIDGMWLACCPQAWGKFWGRNLKFISEHKKVAKAVAGLRISFCGWLLKKIK